MSLPWKSGQRCLVVQCDRDSGAPVEGGHRVEATAVQFHLNADIDVVLDSGSVPDGVWVASRFDGSDAWNSYGRERTWRLMVPEDFMPAKADEETDYEHRHGYWEAGDY